VEGKPGMGNEYPESISLGNLPAYGFFVRHVDGISFRDVSFSFNEKDDRPAILFNDVQNLKLLNVDTEISEDARAQIILQNTSDVFVNGCSPKQSNTFLRVERYSKNISAVGNNFKDVKKPLFIDETIRTADLNIASNLTGKNTLFEFLQPNIERDSLGMVSIYYPNNADVYYTKDGSIPTKESNKYSKPFAQISAATIKAAAFENGMESSIAFLRLEKAQVLSPQISPKDQFFNKEIKVKLMSNTEGVAIYYSLDGSMPTKNSLKYKKPIHINKSEELKTIAIKDGYKDSKESYSNYEFIEELKGVQYKYYETKLEKLPRYMDLTPMRTGVVKKFTIEGIEQSKFNFTLVMHGFLKIKKAGSYQFFISSNDGTKLFIDHMEIINNDGTHGTIEKSGRVQLDIGTHLIEVRYFQAGGVKSLKVSWEGIGFEKHEMNEHDLSPYQK
jgi:hypothetical protein